MGKGKYASGNIEGNIELYVSIEEDPDTPTLERWKKSFEVASRLLYYATGGKAHFASVFLYTNGGGAADADATVSIHQESSYANGHPAVFLEATLDTADVAYERPFAEETVMSLGEDAYRYPFVILHEFGHYGFGLGDEYYEWSTGGPMRCSALQQIAAKPASSELKIDHACIMGVPSLGLSVARFLETTPGPDDFTATPANTATGVGTIAANPATDTANPDYEVRHGWIVEFCTKDNHDPRDSMQNHWHDSSCAEAILENRQISVPSPLKEPDDKEPPASPVVKWPATTNDAEIGAIFDLARQLEITDPSDPEGLAIDVSEYPPLFASPSDEVSLLSFGEFEGTHGFETTASVNEALHRMLETLGGPGPRAAEVALLLFSLGEDRVQDAPKLAASFAANGVRLFTIGVGRDRASLQQLAQRTGGPYFEVDLKKGRKPHENRQLVRNHVARSFDRLRYGAPVALLSREELAHGNVEFQVEKDSKSLKLVFTKTSGSQLRSVILRRNGKKVGVRWTDSNRGSFRTATIDNPKPGIWSIEVASGAPPSLDLAVYSKNPGVRLGVTGWRRLRFAGETVTLQVVVRAPIAVVGLRKAVAKVAPPGRHSTGMFEVELSPTPDGVHIAEFKVEEVGVYDVEVLVRGDGNSVAAGPPSSRAPRVIEGFQRTRRVQVHVTATSGA